MTQLQSLQTKLARLNRQLTAFQKGISKALRSVAVKIIIEIERLESLIFQIAKATQIAIAKRTLTLSTPKRAWRAWVAKISAKRDKVHGGFSKEFIEPIDRQFGKKGEIEATFEIEVDFNQIYQDSDGDFWMFADHLNDEGQQAIKTICYQEVQWMFSQIPF
jgi:hypothetical protein